MIRDCRLTIDGQMMDVNLSPGEVAWWSKRALLLGCRHTRFEGNLGRVSSAIVKGMKQHQLVVLAQPTGGNDAENV